MKKGFTLAEVLITLGVIGVVAALTLPNVLQNFRERTYVASLQRVYNATSNAVATLMAVEDIDDLGQSSLTSPEGRDAFIWKYFKVVNDCGGSFDGCLAGQYEPVERGNKRAVGEISQGGGNWRCVTIDSGCGVCVSTYDTGSRAAYVMIDTNATKGPNINGRDFWQLVVNADGRVGTTNDMANVSSSSYISCEGFSPACVGRVMADGWQMTYTKK